MKLKIKFWFSNLFNKKGNGFGFNVLINKYLIYDVGFLTTKEARENKRSDEPFCFLLFLCDSNQIDVVENKKAARKTNSFV